MVGHLGMKDMASFSNEKFEVRWIEKVLGKIEARV